MRERETQRERERERERLIDKWRKQKKEVKGIALE